MTREVHDVPPAPRHVRWAPVVWCRWPVGLIGLGLAIYGGLVALLFHHVGAANHDTRIEQGPREQAVATVTAVKDLPGGTMSRYSYRFDMPLGVETGDSLGPRGGFAVGDTAPVEFVQGSPEISRLVGTRKELLGDLSTPILGLVVLPGLLLLLVWLQGVMDLRIMLAHGDVTVAELTQVERVPYVVPLMLRVHYRFRDHRARWCEGGHWVRARSALGQRLAASPGCALSIHDRLRPQRNRLITAVDFESGSPAPLAGRPAPHA